MIVCVCNLENMLQLKQESNDKVCAGIEFACVFMLKLNDFAGPKEQIEFSLRIVLLAANQFRCRIVLSAMNQCSLLNCVVCSD